MKKKILSLVMILAMVTTFLSSCDHLFHNYEYLSAAVEATCSQGGIDLYACTDCGRVKAVNTPALEHTYGDWIIDKKPTENETGLRHLECSVCGYKTKPEIMKKQEERYYKLGMGTIVDMNNRWGTVQVDVTVATVVLDDDGKIVLCRIDASQNKTSVTNGEIDAERTFMTKREYGDNYGLTYSPSDANNDGIVLEWYKQAEAFESYVIGKTVNEVANIKTEISSQTGSVIAADDALLTAGCTIGISSFMSAVIKACNDDQGISFMAAPSTFTLGVAISTTAKNSYSATEDSDGAVCMYSDLACAVIDDDGRILAALVDGIQPKFYIDIYGEITHQSYSSTKRELKEEYMLASFGIDSNGDGIVLEWYLQSAAFSKHVAGMTARQVANMTTSANSIGYQMTTDPALLNAGCTIDITNVKAIVAKAADNAR